MLYVKRGIMTEELCSRYIKNKALHCYMINSLQEQGYYSPQVCNDPFFYWHSGRQKNPCALQMLCSSVRVKLA